MSSFGGVVSGIGGLFGDEGKTKTQTNIKNPALQKWIDLGITDYSDLRQSGKDSLSDWVKAYLADSNTAKTRTGQEISNVDRYYSGAVGSDLERLRREREAAVKQAAELGSRYALANVSRSRALGEGGPSSYDRRLGLRSISDIMTQAALDRTGQERSDYDYLERARLGLTGQRQGLADALTGRLMVPETMRRSLYSQDLGLLGALGELDRANKFYGLKYDPSTSERLGQITSDFGSGIMEAAQVVGSLYGMGGMMGGGGGVGAAPTGNQMGAFMGGAGPVSAPAANTWSSNLWSLGQQPSAFPYAFGGVPNYQMPAPGYQYGMWPSY